MKTFNKELKQHWIDTMQAHQDADRLAQGGWWDNEDQKGCFFGCAMQTDGNALEVAIKAMQLPGWLVHLAEAIFERLPEDDALLFPVQLLKTIPVNTDITEVKHAIAVRRLKPLIRSSNSNDVNYAIQQGIEYHKNTERTEEDRIAVNSAAYSVVNSVVNSAAYSAALSAARSARSAADSARSAAWKQEKNNLLQALKEFKA